MNKQVKYMPLIETQTKKTPHKYFLELLTRVQVTSIQFGDLGITLHCIIECQQIPNKHRFVNFRM